MNQAVFKVSSLLISIDGPDGAGKSSFAKVLTAKLTDICGEKKVVLVKPSYFNVSVRARRIGEKINRLGHKFEKYSRLHNAFFLAAMMANYEDVILPVIYSNRMVVLDSSEIRALAFMIDKGLPDAIKDTLFKIQNGLLTQKIQPKLRIVLMGGINDLYRNLNTKKILDDGDPYNKAMIRKRIDAYQKAIKTIKQLAINDEVNWQTITVHHTFQPLHSYFSDIINQNEIISKILISGRI